MKKLIKRIFSGKYLKNGEVYVDTVVKIIICVVVGTLFLTSVVFLNNMAIQKATDKVDDLFGIGDGDIPNMEPPDDYMTDEEYLFNAPGSPLELNVFYNMINYSSNNTTETINRGGFCVS